jgi:hypothetical protein
LKTRGIAEIFAEFAERPPAAATTGGPRRTFQLATSCALRGSPMRTPRPFYRSFNDTWYVQIGKRECLKTAWFSGYSASDTGVSGPSFSGRLVETSSVGRLALRVIDRPHYGCSCWRIGLEHSSQPRVGSAATAGTCRPWFTYCRRASAG